MLIEGRFGMAVLRTMEERMKGDNEITGYDL